MFEIVLTFLILMLLSFIPIIIWAYSFSYIDDNPLNKKRFLIGTLGGILAVFPILNMEKIVNIFDLKYLNVFYYVSNIKNFFSSLEFSFSLSLFLLIIVVGSFILGGYIWNKKDLLKVYAKNILVFLVFVFILGIVVFLLNLLFSRVDIIIDDPVSFGTIIFDTLKLIIFYYLIVAFIEEAAKHFNFLQSSVLYIKSVKEGVLYAIFVALGFSFIENLLYLYNYFSTYGITYDLIKLYFFRSSFSIVVHILSSSVVAYYFSKALILYREKEFSFSYLKIFSYGLLISILLHLIFDVFLTLGFVSVIFIYFIGGYLYVSNIFYRE